MVNSVIHSFSYCFILVISMVNLEPVLGAQGRRIHHRWDSRSVQTRSVPLHSHTRLYLGTNLPDFAVGGNPCKLDKNNENNAQTVTQAQDWKKNSYHDAWNSCLCAPFCTCSSLKSQSWTTGASDWVGFHRNRMLWNGVRLVDEWVLGVLSPMNESGPCRLLTVAVAPKGTLFIDPPFLLIHLRMASEKLWDETEALVTLHDSESCQIAVLFSLHNPETHDHKSDLC